MAVLKKKMHFFFLSKANSLAGVGQTKQIPAGCFGQTLGSHNFSDGLKLLINLIKWGFAFSPTSSLGQTSSLPRVRCQCLPRLQDTFAFFISRVLLSHLGSADRNLTAQALTSGRTDVKIGAGKNIAKREREREREWESKSETEGNGGRDGESNNTARPVGSQLRIKVLRRCTTRFPRRWKFCIHERVSSETLYALTLHSFSQTLTLQIRSQCLILDLM